MPADVDEDGSPGTLVVDGSASCVSGAYVKVSEEFIAWDIFRKFEGKVGRLAWRHFSGMWYADFPGEDEYGFLCGPLLFQLTVSSAEEADAAALRTAELDRQRLESASHEQRAAVRELETRHETVEAELRAKLELRAGGGATSEVVDLERARRLQKENAELAVRQQKLLEEVEELRAENENLLGVRNHLVVAQARRPSNHRKTIEALGRPSKL